MKKDLDIQEGKASRTVRMSKDIWEAAQCVAKHKGTTRTKLWVNWIVEEYRKLPNAAKIQE